MEQKNVFIGNLDFAVTEEEIRILFSDYGSVVHIKMRKKKGCAFVEMSSEAEAALAIEKLNGATFKDREVRVSLELNTKKARAVSIKNYNERSEDISRQKKSGGAGNGSPHATGPDSAESNELFPEADNGSKDESGKSSPNASRPRKFGSAAGKPAGSSHPRKKEWPDDKPAYQNRPPRDGKKTGPGRSPRPDSNYNPRERFSGPDDRPAKNRSRGGANPPHQRAGVWQDDRPSHPHRQPRDRKNSGHDGTPENETNFNTWERFPGPVAKPVNDRPRGRTDSSHPQRKVWSHDKPEYSSRTPRDGKKPGHGRSPRPDSNYNPREQYQGPGSRPPRDRSRSGTDAPHPQRKQWSNDRPSYPSRPSGPSRHSGPGMRDDSGPRHAGGSPNRFSGPKSGPRGKSSPAGPARPKPRSGAGNRDRNSRPKKD